MFYMIIWPVSICGVNFIQTSPDIWNKYELSVSKFIFSRQGRYIFSLEVYKSFKPNFRKASVIYKDRSYYSTAFNLLLQRIKYSL